MAGGRAQQEPLPARRSDRRRPDDPPRVRADGERARDQRRRDRLRLRPSRPYHPHRPRLGEPDRRDLSGRDRVARRPGHRQRAPRVHRAGGRPGPRGRGEHPRRRRRDRCAHPSLRRSRPGPVLVGVGAGRHRPRELLRHPLLVRRPRPRGEASARHRPPRRHGPHRRPPPSGDGALGDRAGGMATHLRRLWPARRGDRTGGRRRPDDDDLRLRRVRPARVRAPGGGERRYPRARVQLRLARPAARQRRAGR